MIREGFFRNYELAQLSPLTRILFQGLWCLADKNGRLWDRPQQIKAECLPYDDCDIEKMLTELTDAGFIQRYEVGGKRCIQVVNFEKHQILTTWEKNTSTDIPAPRGFRRSSKPDQNGFEVDQKSVRSRSALNNNDQNSNDQNGSDHNSDDDLPFVGAEFRTALSEYERHRKEKRSPLTPTAKKRLYKKLKDWGEAKATAALVNSVENGWTGVFEPNGNGTQGATKVDRNVQRVQNVAAEFEAEERASRTEQN